MGRDPFAGQDLVTQFDRKKIETRQRVNTGDLIIGSVAAITLIGSLGYIAWMLL